MKICCYSSIIAIAVMLCTGAHAGRQYEWYRGDMHMHSSYSDGDSPIADVIAAARERELDFISITDHDIMMFGQTPHWNDPDHVSGEVLLIYGVEWTTLKGHANIWAAEPFDYSGLWNAYLFGDASAALTEAHRLGALFSICHPMQYACCPWLYGFRIEADAIEVWNGPSTNIGNRATIRLLWDHLLQQGQRITAVGGSDTHRLRGLTARRVAPGTPTTWVYAADRSAAAILDAVGAGAVSISSAPDCVRLELWAGPDENRAPMGSALPAGNPVTFTVIRTLPPDGDQDCLQCEADLMLLKNGDFFDSAVMAAGETLLQFTDTPAPGDYFRAELRDTTLTGAVRRRALALTNPIFFE